MKKWTRASLLSLLLIMLSVALAYARAGGGGGGGGGGDDDGGAIGLLIWIIIELIPFPYNLVVIALLLIGFWLIKKKAKQTSGLNRIPVVEATKTDSGSYQQFKATNPTFDEARFKAKASQAFTEIQQAWEAQDLSKVRKWISDGVYQRFTTQFAMMKLLEQKNILKGVQVKNLYIADVETDGNYDILHVAMHAQIHDEFVSAKYKNLNSGGLEEFVEFWSFIKKRGAVEKDLYHTDNCQNCGAELPKNAGELSKCEHCGTITNLGDYDWVLSEITQADDYANHLKKMQKDGGLANRIREMLKGNRDFSFQFLEDKASNAYLQIKTALVKKDATLVRRFISDGLYAELDQRVKGELGYIYNRIYLNDVTLMDAYQADGRDNLVFAIKVSTQKVMINGDKAELVDQAVYAHNDVLILSRDSNVGDPKGHLYAHTCPSCGAPIGDTVDPTCSYCGAEVNSTQYEWIVTGLMPASGYTEFRAAHKQELITGFTPEKLDALYEVRDYAFNNLMILISADGHFDDHEKEFAHKLAKRWGYHPDKIQAMYEMARNHKLVLRLPDNAKKRRRVYDLMVKAAHLDGNVTPEEQAVLMEVKRQLDEAA